MIRGTPKFDAMAVGEISVKFIGPQLEFTAKAAFVSMKTGETHGWTSATSAVWSPATVEKLKELRALMEVDLGKLHLENGGETLVGPASSFASAGGGGHGGGNDGPGGIGEHIGGNQV